MTTTNKDLQKVRLPKFNNTNNVVHKKLKERVNEYFTSRGISKKGTYALYIKTALFCTIALILYYFTHITIPSSVVLFIILNACLGITFALIGFNVMHDASHESYARRTWVNKVIVRVIDCMGASSYMWIAKHCTVHHTYTNTEHDDDIQTGGLARFSPDQKLRPFHRYQHIYVFILYALLYILWVFLTDFVKYVRGKIGNYSLQKSMPWYEQLIFWMSKLVYVFLFIVFPILHLGVGMAMLGYIVMGCVCGLGISIVFQLAHVNEKCIHHKADEQTHKIEKGWAICQLESTCDFAPQSALAYWALGGLNFQVIHHLFPDISHVHYPALVPIVKEVCKEYGVPYNYYPTFQEAFRSHIRILRTLGKS